MRKKIAILVESRRFEYLIVALIIINALVLGAETDPSLNASFQHWFEMIHHLILAAFIIEAGLKMFAVWPNLKLYFGNGWNLFDFSVVVLSLIPASGQFAMIARMARLLRVIRLVSTIPELRLIISTLIRSIPSMGNILLLMAIIFYIYGIAGYHLFHQIDPTHWKNLGTSLLTLFRIVTLEDWTDIMYAAMEHKSWSWIYFVSFVICGTFVVINLFIAVVLNNLDEAKRESLKELRESVSPDELSKEIESTQIALQSLQERIQTMADEHRSNAGHV